MPKATPPRKHSKTTASQKKKDTLPDSDGRLKSEKKIKPAYDRYATNGVLCKVEGCTEELDSTAKLLEHMQERHLVKHDKPVGPKLYKCCWKGCTQQSPFSFTNFVDHLRRHTGARLPCPYEEPNLSGEVISRCSDGFVDRKGLSTHFPSEHGITLRSWKKQQRDQRKAKTVVPPTHEPMLEQAVPPPSSTDASVLLEEVQLPIASASPPRESPVTPKKTAQKASPTPLTKRSPRSPNRRGRRLSPRKAKAHDTSNAENAAPPTTSDEKAKQAGPTLRRATPFCRQPRFINSAHSRASSVTTLYDGSARPFPKGEVYSGVDFIVGGWDDETVAGDFTDVDWDDAEEELEVNALLSSAEANSSDVSMSIDDDENEIVFPDSDGDEDPYDDAPASKHAVMDVEASTCAGPSRSRVVKDEPMDVLLFPHSIDAKSKSF